MSENRSGHRTAPWIIALILIGLLMALRRATADKGGTYPGPTGQPR